MNSLLLGIAGSSILIGGYKYYKYCQDEKEYKKLSDIFQNYESNKLLKEYDLKKDNKDEYEPFRVIQFESLSEMT